MPTAPDWLIDDDELAVGYMVVPEQLALRLHADRSRRHSFVAVSVTFHDHFSPAAE